MSDENETLDAPELHPEVAALDEKLATAHMEDEDRDALNALIEERNEAYKRNHPVPQDAQPS